MCVYTQFSRVGVLNLEPLDIHGSCLVMGSERCPTILKAVVPISAPVSNMWEFLLLSMLINFDIDSFQYRCCSYRCSFCGLGQACESKGEITSPSSLKEYGSKGEKWHLYNRDSQTSCASDDVIDIFIYAVNKYLLSTCFVAGTMSAFMVLRAVMGRETVK